MKKYLCMLAVVGLASSAFAQGLLTFQSGTKSILETTGTAVASGGGFVQLFWAPAGSAFTAMGAGQGADAFLAANPVWKTDAAYIKPITAGGRFNGGLLTLPTPTAGANIDAVVAAWKGSAATLDAAIQAGADMGWSAKMANVATGNPNTTPAGLPGTLNGPFQGIQLVAVPEPTTLALAGLGAAALLIFRRRN